jgi:MFS family permease
MPAISPDRIGRTIMIAIRRRGRCFAVMAWAVHVRLAFWPASGILSLSYLAGSVYQPVADAAVSDLVPRERRLDAYALSRVANNLGWGVGPMLGGMVSEIGYAWLFVFGGLTSAISSWLLWGRLTETHGTERRAAMLRGPIPDGWMAEIRRILPSLRDQTVPPHRHVPRLATLTYTRPATGSYRTQLGLLSG